MRVMPDAITDRHKLVLASFVVEEMLAVVERKFPGKKEAVDEFLSNLTYELVYTPHNMKADIF